jgi:carbonic anhydrase
MYVNPSNWSYGAFNGPTFWGKEFPGSGGVLACDAASGQSPIAIPSGLTPDNTLPQIQFSYNASTVPLYVEYQNYAIELLAPNGQTLRTLISCQPVTASSRTQAWAFDGRDSSLLLSKRPCVRFADSADSPILIRDGVPLWTL